MTNNISPVKRLNKIYRLTIQLLDDNGNTTNQAIVLSNTGDNPSPLTINFTVKRTILNEMNSLDVDVYNLAPTSYNKVFYDYYATNSKDWRGIVLEAGYKDSGLVEIFRGNIWSAYTRRKGSDVITTISARTGIKQFSSYTNVSFDTGTSTKEIVTQAAKDMKIGVEVYSDLDETLQRPTTVFGPSYKIIQRYTGGNTFIDGNKLKVLYPDDVIKKVSKITSESGLLDQPQRENSTLKIKCMFNPAYFLGQVIEIDSRVASQFNGQYKLAGIVHSGTMSETTASPATTELELWTAANSFGGFNAREKQ